MVFIALMICFGLCLLVRRLKQDRVTILELKHKVESYEKEKNKESKRHAGKNHIGPATNNAN